MFTKQFQIVIGVIIYLVTVGALLVNQVSLKRDVEDLKARPVAVMPMKEVTPTASPEATLVPTKLPIRIVSPTK